MITHHPLSAARIPTLFPTLFPSPGRPRVPLGTLRFLVRDPFGFPGRPTGSLVASVTMTPTPTDLPGGQVLQQLTNGIGGWALIASLVGLVVGAGVWALGSHGQNYQQSYVGRRAVLISGLAALLIGAGPAIVNFFFTTGQGVH